MKAIKLKTSGSFRTEPGIDKNRMPFADLEMIIPAVPEAFYFQSAMRMFPIYLRKDKRFDKTNNEGLIKIFIDQSTEVDFDFGLEGKGIKEMDWVQLQAFASSFKLREIPLYQAGELRTAREKAYLTYLKVIKQKKIIKTVVDKKQAEETIIARCQILRMTEQEQEAELVKARADWFVAIQDPNNPERSYDFAKVEDIIPFKVDKKEVK